MKCDRKVNECTLNPANNVGYDIYNTTRNGSSIVKHGFRVSDTCEYLNDGKCVNPVRCINRLKQLRKQIKEKRHLAYIESSCVRVNDLFKEAFPKARIINLGSQIFTDDPEAVEYLRGKPNPSDLIELKMPVSWWIEINFRGGTVNFKNLLKRFESIEITGKKIIIGGKKMSENVEGCYSFGRWHRKEFEINGLNIIVDLED